MENIASLKKTGIEHPYNHPDTTIYHHHRPLCQEPNHQTASTQTCFARGCNSSSSCSSCFLPSSTIPSSNCRSSLMADTFSTMLRVKSYLVTTDVFDTCSLDSYTRILSTPCFLVLHDIKVGGNVEHQLPHPLLLRLLLHPLHLKHINNQQQYQELTKNSIFTSASLLRLLSFSSFVFT